MNQFLLEVKLTLTHPNDGHKPDVPKEKLILMKVISPKLLMEYLRYKWPPPLYEEGNLNQLSPLLKSQQESSIVLLQKESSNLFLLYCP